MQVIDALISELRESGSYNSAVQAAPSVDEWLERVKQQIVDKLKDGPVTF